MMRHPFRHSAACAEARSLIAKYDGEAVSLIERSIDERISRGDMDDALHLDQVRRAVESMNSQNQLALLDAQLTRSAS